MYLMAQNGISIVKLFDVEVEKRGNLFYVMHNNGQYFTVVAVYQTEPEAKAQLTAIPDALMKGRPLYCFD